MSVHGACVYCKVFPSLLPSLFYILYLNNYLLIYSLTLTHSLTHLLTNTHTCHCVQAEVTRYHLRLTLLFHVTFTDLHSASDHRRAVTEW